MSRFGCPLWNMLPPRNTVVHTRSGYHITAIGLSFFPGKGEELYEPIGQFLDAIDSGRVLANSVPMDKVENGRQWSRGDWYSIGYKIKRLSHQFFLDSRQAHLLRYTAESFSYGRRRVNLSFQHHACIANMTEQRQDELLDQATAEQWTISQLIDAAAGRKVNSDICMPLLQSERYAPLNKKKRGRPPGKKNGQSVATVMPDIPNKPRTYTVADLKIISLSMSPADQKILKEWFSR